MRRAKLLAVTVTVLGLAACDSLKPVDSPAGDPSLASLKAPASNPTPSTISLEAIATVQGGAVGAAEITAFDRVSKRLFVVNGANGTIDVLDLKDPASPRLEETISLAAFGGAANSVATHNGVVAVAVEASVKTAPGTVVFYRATTLRAISSVQVGALPDMVTFTPDGKSLLVANEGEPNNDYTVDPEGSISVIDVSNINRPTVRTAGFGSYNGRLAELRASGVRLFGPGATVAQDLEPEYIAISQDGRTAFATLQENNALAIVDIASATVTRIVPLGYKDHSLPGNGIDASDRDGPVGGPMVNIRTWPVLGMYQPDAIASYSVGGRTYLVTANEGDARDWTGTPGLREESRVNALPLNPAIFTDQLCGGPCASNAFLGRLTVTNQNGQNPTTGLFDQLYAFGARSFSIWSDDGSLVWDSGDDLERRTTNLPMVNFNASSTGNTLDDRSDNKGPEPEGLALGTLGNKTFAFVGLERTGGVMVYDITRPSSPMYVTYASERQGDGGDLGPEGLTFIPAVESPSKEPLLVVGNEISGTTTIFRIRLH